MKLGAARSESRIATRLGGYDATKRASDLILASVAMVPLLPFMALLGVLIRLDSEGPAIFRQERVGYGGRTFKIWKFRSMHLDSSDEHHRADAAAWFAGDPAPHGYKATNDPRITRMGRFLRRSSLDELPQLFNVLAGHMTLVGPRPAIPYELEMYEPWYFQRFDAKPGITGLWQVSGRDRTSAAEMMALDIRYLRERSLTTDLKILIRTLPTALG
jgi:lipopolysaccharide/colanic/teichoic acid biosynthesis glycosyltransferase